MSVSLRNVGVITLFMEDLDRAKLIYQDIFGLPVVFEDESSAVFNFENISINLLSIDEAPDLIEPAAVASREAGSRFQFTIQADDVDVACAELAGRGVALLNGPMNRQRGIRTASFTDPGGHIWRSRRSALRGRIAACRAAARQRSRACIPPVA